MSHKAAGKVILLPLCGYWPNNPNNGLEKEWADSDTGAKRPLLQSEMPGTNSFVQRTTERKEIDYPWTWKRFLPRLRLIEPNNWKPDPYRPGFLFPS